MNATKTLKELFDGAEVWTTHYRVRIKLLSSMINRLEELDISEEKLEVMSNGLDFNHLTHEEVIRLISFFGGKWTKEVNEACINYSTTTNEGITIRAWAGEPPPSCKVIEVEEYVPASVRTVRKLQCPETLSND